MNKSDLIDAIAADADIPRTTAQRALDACFDTITNALKEGDPVTIVGFGTFLTRAREARKGRNPKTGEPIDIPASNIPAFKPGKGLKDAVN